MSRLLAFLVIGLQLLGVLAQSKPSSDPLTINVKVKTGVRNKTAPLLHGLMYEEINVRLLQLKPILRADPLVCSGREMEACMPS
jgi:hypothetical protein